MSLLRSVSLAVLMPLMLIACRDAGPVETDASNISNPVDIADSVETEWTMGPLSGAFRNAGPNSPSVLIVPGSGPTDRDGNSPAGIKANTYKLLADGLEANGVSSLRVDKRGMYTSGAAGDPNAVTVDIYSQDYRDWAQQLRENTGADCVYLLGHSEGGMMVSAAAAGEREGLCGLILVAAPGRPFADVLREQLQANPANAPVLPDALGAIDALNRGDRIDVQAFHPALQGLFAPQVQDFLISAFAVDPAALVRDAAVPTLILQGDRDLQVSVADAERLADAGGTLVVLPGVNHVLKDASEARAENFATYSNPDLPLSGSVVPAIIDFMKD